uniref:HEPN domain-containing protein n=1 Tax=Panagrellus redivivus TaxID=6233 RepID=A0A7E4UVH9_PANRE
MACNETEMAKEYFYGHLQRSLGIVLAAGYEMYTLAYHKGARIQLYAIIEIIRYCGKKFMWFSELSHVYAVLYGQTLDDKTLKHMLNQGGNEYALKLFRGCPEFFKVRKNNIHSIDFELALADPTYDNVPPQERRNQIEIIYMSLDVLSHDIAGFRDIESLGIKYLIDITLAQIERYRIPSDCGDFQDIEQELDLDDEAETATIVES